MALPISTGSGATLASNIINGSHYQIISGVSLYPSDQFIGLVSTASIQGQVSIVGTPTVNVNGLLSLASGTNVQATQSGTWNVGVNGLVSLASGTEVKSLATILNFPAVQAVSFDQLVSLASGTNIQATQSGTWNTGITGVVSLASGQEIRSLATITNFPAVQAVSQSGNWSVGLTGLVSLASGTSVLTSFSGVVSLASGTEVRSLATIMNWPTTQAVTQSGNWNVGITGLVSLASGTSVLTSFSGVLSLASGQEIRSLATINNFPTSYPVTNLVSVASINGLVDVKQSGNWNVGVTGLISLASGTSVLTSFSGLISLASGTEVRSLATIMNWPTTQAVTQSGNWNVGITGLVSLASGTSVLTSFSGLISLASGTEVRSLATINNFPTNYPVTNLVSVASINGLVDVKQNGTWNVGITGLISLASGTSVLTSFGGVISLASGTEVRSLATIMNWPATQAVTQSGAWNVGLTGLMSLPSGQEVRSLATILNFPTTQAVTQSGAWSVGVTGLISLASGTSVLTSFSGLISLASGTEVRSLATIMNFPAVQAVSQNGTWNVGLTGLMSLASGQEIRSLATILNFPTTQAVSFNQLVSLASGTIIQAAQSGTWTVQPGNTANSTPWLVTQTNGLISLASGTVVLTKEQNLVSLASGTLVGLNPSTNFIGLASVQGNVNIQSGATVTPIPLSGYTSFATVISASGNATLFVPPASNRWILKDLIVTSQGQTQVGLISGTVTKIPPVALATMGGYVSNANDSGFLSGTSINDSFVVVNNSAVTIGVMANVRFSTT